MLRILAMAPCLGLKPTDAGFHGDELALQDRAARFEAFIEVGDAALLRRRPGY